MELRLEIKQWPSTTEPFLTDIENLYVGPVIGDVITDENDCRWVARDEVSRFELQTRGYVGIIGDYQYYTKSFQHIITIKDSGDIKAYVEHLLYRR
jgi:hypothetical protein